MKYTLAIQRYIDKFGLDKAVEDFKLIAKYYPNKVLLKYNQIESDLSHVECQECRGLILELNTWKVLSLGFFKFFNSFETNAHKVDWDSAYVLEKLDGTMVQVYFDWNAGKWFAGTTGTAEGEGEVNNKFGTTFSDLFWKTVEDKYNFNTCMLVKGNVYVFELTTPYNIVVKPHGVSSATLLTMRTLHDMNEVSYEVLEIVANSLGVPVVKRYDLNSNVEVLLETFKDMIWHDEGYVVVDAFFNRVKVKNPAYVAVHHTKSKLGLHHIMEVIKRNEIEEYVAVFTEREEELRGLDAGYKELISKLSECWRQISLLSPKSCSREDRKKFAINVFSISEKNSLREFSGLFFSLNDGKVNSIKDYVREIDNKRLYQLLINQAEK